jgi:hypothetical protein
MGGGQHYPMMLQHSVTNAAILAGLFGQKCFEQIAGWTNGMPSILACTSARSPIPSSIHGLCAHFA